MRQITILFMSLLSGVCFGVALSTFLLTEGYLSNYYRAYIVQSGSMAPSLPVGSIVITKTAAVYSEGDIITFTPEGTKNQITHRIVSVGTSDAGATFTTKGDANEEADSWRITQDRVLGKSLFIIPKLGYLADFVRTPKGFVALVVIPASIIIYEELKAIVRELAKLIFRRKGNPENGIKTAAAIPILGVLLMLAGPTSSFVFNTETSRINLFKAHMAPETSPSPTPSSEPELNLVINEFMPHPTTDDKEWVEIYNPTNQPISLAGWALDEQNQNPKTLDSLGSVPALGFVVYENPTTGWLNDGGEKLDLLLLNPQTQIIDSHTYSNSSLGVSIGRQPNGTGDFKNCTQPSKGATNNQQC